MPREWTDWPLTDSQKRLVASHCSSTPSVCWRSLESLTFAETQRSVLTDDPLSESPDINLIFGPHNMQNVSSAHLRNVATV